VAVTLKAPAPQVEIGYAQAVNYQWWLYENETTPELIWPQSTFVFDSMRRTDSQVTSVLRAMTLPVRRTPWRIDPNGARPEVVQFVADDLGLPIVGQKTPKPPPRSKDRFSWPDHLRQALLMLSYGHMYFEQVYRVDPDGSAAHLRKLAPRMPKTIERIDVAADGGLVSIKQYWSSTNNSENTIPVNRLVAYIHEREGGNWLGTSILRPAYKNWLLKDRLLRVQAQTIERNGMGIPLYKAAEGATDLSTGLAMAKAWRAGDAAGSAVPFGADLILRGVEGTLPDAEPAVRYHDEQIGRAVLAHFLNLGTQTGSWALGTTFADFFTLSLQTLADQVADTATQHIVEDLVDINFGEDEPAPRIVCDEIGSRQAATAEALAALIDSGVIRPDEVLEESSRQQYGLPPADPKTTRTPPAPGGGQPPIPTDGSATPGDPAPAAAADPNATDASAAVAAMQVVAAAAAPEVELLGEDIDEQADAITAALDEWVEAQLPEQVEAKFNPDELRVPGHHAGGGRWTKSPIGQAISDALDAWGKGKGPDDPFVFDGKPIDREPLRKAAVARGITLKRGASRDDIVHALLGGVREEVKTQRAERQKRVGSSKFSIDVGGKVDPEAARQVEVENKIREVYAEMATRPGEYVPLAGLRDRLAEDNMRRTEVDEALKRMAVQPGNHVIPWDNTKALSAADRKAALRFGGQDNHVLRIEDTTPRPMPTPVGGKRIDVAIYTGTDPNAPSLREVSSASRPGRVITSQPDLAGLEQWAHDNGHTDVAQWAASERARAEAKSAPKPAKVAKKAAAPKAVKAVPSDAVSPEEHALANDFQRRADAALTGPRAMQATHRQIRGDDGEVVDDYRADSAARANDVLRKYDGDLARLTKDDRRVVTELDRIVATSPLTKRDIVVYRGVSSDDKRMFDGKDPAAGFEFVDHAFVATTAGDSADPLWTGNSGTQMRILVPAGTRAMSNPDHLDYDEVLLPRGLRYRVVEDHGRVDGVRHIDVEVVGSVDAPGKSGPSVPVLASDLPAEPDKYLGKTVRFTVPDRYGREGKDKTYEGKLLSATRIAPSGGDAATGVRIEGVTGTIIVPDTVSAEVHGVGAPKVPAKKTAAKAVKSAPTKAATKRVPKAAKAAPKPATPGSERTDNERFGGGIGKKALPPSKSASPRAQAVATDPALTDGEKRSRLKALGLTPGQIDALVPPAGGARPKAGSGPVASGRGALTAGQLDLSGVRKVPGVTDAERKAADLYANDAQRINNLVREGRTGSATIRNLDGLLDHSTVGSDVELWRGLRSGEGQFGDRLSGDLTGAEFTEPAYLSTTANRQVAEQFAGSFGDPAPVVMHLVAPAGTNAITVSDWGSGDAIGGQAEVLLQRGLRMRVVADHGVEPHPQIPAGVRRLDVEIVPIEPSAIRSSSPDWANPEAEGAMEDVTAAAGQDVTPGHDQLHHYWTVGPGLAKWAEAPKPWTTLRDHLLKYMPEGEATRAASRWFIEVFHFAAGSDLNRVTHGKPPRGRVVGPG
jgi:hypothetical protein